MIKKLVAVRFKKPTPVANGLYNTGDVAGFPQQTADFLVRSGDADYVVRKEKPAPVPVAEPPKAKEVPKETAVRPRLGQNRMISGGAGSGAPTAGEPPSDRMVADEPVPHSSDDVTTK